MSTHPHAARGTLSQERIEIGPITPVVSGVNPHQHAVNIGKPRANFILDIIFVDDRFRRDTGIRQRCEDGLNRPFSGVGSRRAASSPRQRIATRPRQLVDPGI